LASRKALAFTDGPKGDNSLRGLLAIGFGHLALETLNNFLPILYPALVERLGLSYTQVGLIVLAHSAMGSFPQPLVGWLTDRRGGRWMAWACIAWLGVWAAGAGFTWSFGSLLVCAAMMGLASAVYHPVGASGSSAVIPDRPGAATSVFSVLGSTGAALSPVLVTWLMGQNGSQATIWLLPIGLLSGLALWRLLPPMRPRVRSEVATQTAGETRRDSILRLALVIGVSIGQAWFIRILRSYTPLLFVARGLDEAAASYVLFIISIVGAVGTVVGGVLLDRIGPTRVLILAWSLAVPSAALFYHAFGAYTFVLAGVVGFLTCMTFPVLIVLASQAWRRRPALSNGLTLGIGWGSAGLGVTLAGMIADRYGLLVAMDASLIPAGLVALLGCVLHLILRRREARGDEAQVG
jgi:FSR family fosmidomycin resistance protein-like MFS transporter